MVATTRSSILLGLLLLHGVIVSSAEQSPFLKEILSGRCYDQVQQQQQQQQQPRTTSHRLDVYYDGNARLFSPAVCPDVVGNIMGVLEGHLDSAITPSDFDSYVRHAKFFDSPPTNKAMFWLPFLGETPQSEQRANFVKAMTILKQDNSYVTPEDTLGGILMKDLTFCGIDQRENCQIFESNAYWSFWEAAYAEFASRVHGGDKVHVFVESMADVNFFIRSVLPSLKVISMSVYSDDCTTDTSHQLLSAVEHSGIDVSCEDDIMTKLSHCTSGDTNNSKTRTDDDKDIDNEDGRDHHRRTKHHHHHFIGLVIFGMLVWCCFRVARDSGAFDADSEMNTWNDKFHQYGTVDTEEAEGIVNETNINDEEPTSAETRYQ